jgi:hypothetical protein
MQAFKKFVTSHRQLTATLATIFALCIAYLYYFIVLAETSSIRVVQTILIYGHSLCWVFLAVASIFWGFGRSKKWYMYFAYAALVTYLVFIATYIINKFI